MQQSWFPASLDNPEKEGRLGSRQRHCGWSESEEAGGGERGEERQSSMQVLR